MSLTVISRTSENMLTQFIETSEPPQVEWTIHRFSPFSHKLTYICDLDVLFSISIHNNVHVHHVYSDKDFKPEY